MKVMLLAAPYVGFYGPIRRAAGTYFPLGLGYIAAVVRDAGHSVSLYEPEAQGLNEKALQELLRTEQPDLVGIGSATPNFPNAVRIARMCKEESDAVVVMGGVHASALAEQVIEENDAVDYVVVGEGEDTMRELAQVLENGGAPATVPGLCLRDGAGIRRTAARPPIRDLDRLPFPARDLIPQRLFAPNAHNWRRPRCATILTSRGCPFRCSFCASKITMGSKFRTHSPEYVLDEMRMLKTDYGIQQLVITDDTFTIKRERLVAVCEGMLREKLGLEWFCFSQVSAVDEEILRLMKRAGCYNIGFGVESGTPRILKILGKPPDLTKNLEIMRVANRLGLKTQAFFVLGCPEAPAETKEEMEATIEYAIKLRPTLAFFNMYTPYPGTRHFEALFGPPPYGKIAWERFVAIGPQAAVESGERPVGELEEIIQKANRRFYFRVSQLIHILLRIGTWHELKQYLRGLIALVLQMASWKQPKRDR